MKAHVDLVLGGRYRLKELLATGGMGEVWSANDQSVGRQVAVKVLREEYTGNQEFLRRLRTEARNSAALAHPNIAQMFDYGEEAGTGYLVMELVPGESLADLLDRQPILTAQQLIPILADTARGLQHAHQNSVIHRDVKPGNILLQEVLPGTPYKVKITDFGVSLAANQAPMTATGMVMGTAQYLSPEQAVGNPATARSDLYALGVIAYEASVGKRPFTGKSPVDIAIAHVNDPVPPLPRHVDQRLANIIMSLLAKDPDQRPQNAAVLAAELDALVTPPPRRYSHSNTGSIPIVGQGTVTQSVMPDVSHDVVAAPAAYPENPEGIARGFETPPIGGASTDGTLPSRAARRAARMEAAAASGINPDLSAPLPAPVRRPISPVAPVETWAEPPVVHRTRHQGHVPNRTSYRHVPANKPASTAGLRNSHAPATARQSATAQTTPTPPKAPSKLLIGAIVVGLIIVLYLIVRHFAAESAGLTAQMFAKQGTIGLAAFFTPISSKRLTDKPLTRFELTNIGRHLGG